VIAVRFEDKRVDLEPGDTVEVSIRHDGERKTIFSETVPVS